MPSPRRLLVASLAGAAVARAPVKGMPRTPDSCPDYTEYARTPHEPRSGGPLALPDMRPSPECRTFNSSAVEVSCLEERERRC